MPLIKITSIYSLFMKLNKIRESKRIIVSFRRAKIIKLQSNNYRASQFSKRVQRLIVKYNNT